MGNYLAGEWVVGQTPVLRIGNRGFVIPPCRLPIKTSHPLQNGYINFHYPTMKKIRWSNNFIPLTLPQAPVRTVASPGSTLVFS